MIKKQLIIQVLFFTASIALQNIQAQNASSTLNWIKVTQTKLSTQLMFDFSELINFKKTVDVDHNQLHISFAGIVLNESDAQNIINELQKTEVIKMVDIHTPPEKNNVVDLTITFYTQEEMSNNEPIDQATKREKKLLIKWSTLNDPDRLIIDIFSVDTLEKIQKENAVLFYAHNNTTKKKRSSIEKKLRIMLDTDYKKNKSIHYARKTTRNTYKLLQRHHNRTILQAQATNKQLSSLERIELAQQLKVDLYVSLDLQLINISHPQTARPLYTHNNNYSHKQQHGFFFSV